VDGEVGGDEASGGGVTEKTAFGLSSHDEQIAEKKVEKGKDAFYSITCLCNRISAQLYNDIALTSFNKQCKVTG
jgi:hypothetical protein